MTKLQILRLPLLVIFFSLILPSQSSTADNTLGKYLIDFVPVASDIESSPITENRARSLIDSVNISYNEITEGKVTLKFGRYLPEIKPSKPLKQACEIPTLLGSTIRTSAAGYKGVVTVAVIPKDKSINFGGEECTKIWISGASKTTNLSILLNGLEDLNLDDETTFLHEFGHALGLKHAASLQCSGETGNVSCSAEEYGDFSDVMGTYAINLGLAKAIMRTNASFLDQLSLLKSEQISYAPSSMITYIAPLYPLSTSGIKVLYLPLYNQKAFSIEYRPAVGEESGLSQNSITAFAGANWQRNMTPTHGLQVRYLLEKPDSGQPLLPKISNGGIATSFIFSNKSNRFGMDVGDNLKLPDGSLIEFLDLDSIKGAHVRITRPVENAAIQKVPVIQEKRTCSEALCYVGVNWKLERSFWSAGAPILQLQKKIDGKWKVVATANLQSGSKTLKGFPFFYDLSYTNDKAGKFTYRIFMPAFKIKNKNFSSYTGKEFVQKVLP
jgi:hypothetical protein